MAKPRLLDLFCGAGGASMGYHRAGFEVVGVDIKPQPRYPFSFIQADAADCSLAGFDAVAASPPCQDHSRMSKNYKAPSHGTAHYLLSTIDRLKQLGKPFIVENVEMADMPGSIVLCGAAFGLGVSGMDLARHRKFYSNKMLFTPGCVHERGNTIGVYGNGTNKWHREKLGRNITAVETRECMGIDWMTRAELSQAIPPAYTEYLGRQLIEFIK